MLHCFQRRIAVIFFPAAIWTNFISVPGWQLNTNGFSEDLCSPQSEEWAVPSTNKTCGKKALLKGHEQKWWRKISPFLIFTRCLNISAQVACLLCEDHQAEKNCVSSHQYLRPRLPQEECSCSLLVTQFEWFGNIEDGGKPTQIIFDVSDKCSVQFATCFLLQLIIVLKKHYLRKYYFKRTLFKCTAHRFIRC